MVEVRFINDTTPIEVTSDEQETQIGVVSETQATEIQVGGLAHADLSGRDLPDQHPIGAITGLQDALDDCVDDAELEAALLEKQDVIRDLSEIRQGATLGATAVQPSDLESYATKDYVDDGLAEKQDTLTAGANVQIVGNTISATDTTYTAGTGIDITNGIISNTQTSAIWGNITGTLSAQTDLQNALNAKANTADIPTATSDLTNDSGFITLSALTPYATQTWVSQQGYLTEIPAEYVTDSELTAKGYQTAADVETAITAKGYTTMSAVEAKGYITNAALVGYATENWVTSQNYITGDYVGNAVLTIQRNSVDVDTFTANAKVNKAINITVPTTAAEVDALPDSTKYGASIDLSLDTTNYKLTLTLKDQDGTILNSKTVDFPIESVVVNGAYDSINKKIVLTLQNGNTIDIPVGDLIAGLQTEITSENKLDADLVDDSTSTSKFVTSNEKNTWNSKQDTISDLATIRSGASAGATAVQPSDLATVATSGSYTDLTNKPTIPAAQIQSDWTQTTTTAVDYIKNKPTLATVATSGSYNDLSNKPTIPSDTSDLTNGAGYITSSALSGYATETWVGNQGYLTGITSSDVTTALGYTPYNASNPNGYITNDALAPYALTSSLATVATSGLYSDLTGTPTIPTVNNATITFTQGGTTKGTITLNQASNQTIAFDAAPTNMVTTDTTQDITGEKTFIGEKRIKFKQSTSSNKLGFTLYSNTGTEYAALELRPNTINGKPILTLNSQNLSTAFVGFRYWGSPASNILAPQPTTAGNYFITVGVTDGTNTVTTTDNGVLDISTLLSGKQDTISDLATIRSGAALGATAVQPSDLATVATSGSYTDLSDKPTIPTVNNPTITFTQGGTTKGIITLNQSNDETIELDVGSTITVDSALSLTSENPVQNKVVTQALTELSANVNMDAYLDMIIAGNTSDLPIIAQSTYSDDLDDIIGGTYDNNS